MRTALTFLATVALTLGLASAAAAAPCKDAAGKFTKCPATAAATADYSLDAKGNCHDAKGKMAKKSLCAAAAPAASAAATPAAATASTSTKTTTTASSDGPKCTKGKRCGNACISVKDVCHK
jgi:hypothetical protein